MLIRAVELEDLKEILEIQYLAFEKEAEEYNYFNIDPLKQTLSNLEVERS